MDHFYVIANRQKDENLETTRRIYNYLLARGKDCTVREYQNLHTVTEKGLDGYTDAAQIPEGTDCILVLGGDGTLIQAARDTVERNIPLLGINLGTLGYLAEIEKSKIEDALDNLILDQYIIEPRMMLEGSVYVGGKKVLSDIALNDIVVNREGFPRIMDYEIWVNDELLNRYAADGVIVSTPTGSTGYSLSAGGPIVSPKASMIVVTPICPHTLNARSIVLSGGDEVRLRLGKSRKGENENSYVTFDGEVLGTISNGDYVEIKKSSRTTNILKISKASFLEVLRSKMSGN